MQNLGVNPNIELRLNLWITHRYVLILLDEPCPSRRKKEGIFTLRFLFSNVLSVGKLGILVRENSHLVSLKNRAYSQLECSRMQRIRAFLHGVEGAVSLAPSGPGRDFPKNEGDPYEP